MKTKILNALKTEYSKLGLGDKAFDGVASFLEKTITDENDIITSIKGDGVVALLKSIQGESDSLRNARVKAERDLEDYKKSHPDSTPKEPEQKEPEKPEINPQLAKFMADFEEMKTRYAQKEESERRATMMSDVRRKLEESNRGHNAILNLVLKNPEIAKDDTAETLSDRLSKEYDAQYKAFYGDGIVPPFGGSVTPMNEKDPFKDVVSSLQRSGILDQDKE